MKKDKKITAEDLQRAVAEEMRILFELNREQIIARAKARLAKQHGQQKLP